MRVLTIGTFDLLHPGHLELLEGCRAWAGPEGQVWVGVNTDTFIARYKGHAPRQTLAHRVEMLRSLRGVDAVVVNVGDENAGVLIDAVRPELILIGDDWLPEERYLAQLGVTPEWMAERGLRVEYLPRTRGTASSAFRAACPGHVQSGALADSGELLWHPGGCA